MFLPLAMLSMFLLMRVSEISLAYVNVALYKPTYMHYPLIPGNDTYEASNAVDGRKSDLSADGGQCAISNLTNTSTTLWVNLTSIYSIHHITSYFPMGSVKGSWFSFSNIEYHNRGFSVYVSNTTDRSQGTLCFNDNNFTRNPKESVLTTNCYVHGQYVIYYNERLPGVVYHEFLKYVLIVLCEVEVYGCPTTGYYGSNCSIPCSDVNCQYCHIETGTCQGCKPGYQGHRCELECEARSFGIKCNGTCGHCRDINQYSNVNGTCLTGCGIGYTGE